MIGNLKYFSNRYCAHIRKLQTNLFQHEYTSCQMSTATQAVKKVEKQRERKLDKDSKESKSFVTNMFVGRTVTEQLLPFPNYLSMEQLETLQMLVDPSEKFFSECNDAAANDEQETIIESTLEGLKELGCFGLQIPAEYGGIGLNNTQYARLVEICGSHDLGIGVTLGAHQSIGLKGILICGTEEQKKKYLPRLATGEHCAAFALTEPSSGSDAMSIRSRAVPSADGSHYILNGSKIWITNGGFAEIFTVFAQTPVKSEKTGEMEEKITAFIVERGFGGLSNSSPEKKMGIKASKSVEVYFDNVKIPAENVLGEVGKGFKVAMEILNNGRFGMAAAMTGTIRHAVQKATDFASNRTQFGKKIQEFEMIQEKIARMTMYHYISESLAYMISGNMDNKSKDYHLEAAISKVFASEAAWHSTDEAIQILGGMGYMKDSGLERVMRDLRIFRIFEGTNDILRLFVALTGLQYAGGHLKELQKAMKNPASNVGLIIGEGTKRARKAVGFLKPKIEGVHPSLEPAASFVAECVELFGSTSESLLIKHGKNIIEQQFVLNRIADSAIDIYTSAVVISRASKALKEGLPSAEHEKKMALVWVSEASARVAKNLTSTKSGRKSEDFSAMQEISREVCENGGVVALRPLGI